MRGPWVLQARVWHIPSASIVLLLIIFVLGIVSDSNSSIIVVVDIYNYWGLVLRLLDLGQRA
jgi:hypothetical protein